MMLFRLDPRGRAGRVLPGAVQAPGLGWLVWITGDERAFSAGTLVTDRLQLQSVTLYPRGVRVGMVAGSVGGPPMHALWRARDAALVPPIYVELSDAWYRGALQCIGDLTEDQRVLLDLGGGGELCAP